MEVLVSSSCTLLVASSASPRTSRRSTSIIPGISSRINPRVVVYQEGVQVAQSGKPSRGTLHDIWRGGVKVEKLMYQS